MYWLVVGCFILLFGAVVLRGAPYVPTLRRGVKDALDLLDLNNDDLIIDLGSGDGNILKAAAQRGYKALGYEINPLLCVVSRLRTLPQRGRITVLWRDFWLAEWPKEAKAAFVFLAGPYMNHLSRKLAQTMNERSEPLVVISYGFAIPGYLPKKISHGFYLYELKPTNDPQKVHWNPRIPHPKLFRRK